jgi:hypothetical protein
MGFTLPKHLKVHASTEKTKALVAGMRAKVEAFTRTIDSPIHISDMINPRIGYWQRISPKSFDDAAIMYFNLGYAIHEYLLGKVDEGGKVQKDICWTPDKRVYEWFTIEGHGAQHSKLVAIVEVKSTTVRRIYSTKRELHKYLEQTLAYMAKEHCVNGEIWVWYVGYPAFPRLQVYTVEATPQALGKYRKQIDTKAKELRMALTERDHTKLELCEKKLCYRSKCKWYDECQPEGRWKPKKEMQV